MALEFTALAVDRLRSNPPLLWLSGAITMAAAPHMLRTPVWVPIMYLVLVAWRLRMPRAARPLPGILKVLIGAVVVAGVLASYGTLTGRDAGVALLILLAALKLTELPGQRDYYIAVCIGLFLLLTNFFWIQSLLTAAYMAVTVAVFITTLITLNDERGVRLPRQHLRLAGAMLLQALPLMLVLFLLFPRIPGPLWGLPRDAQSGRTGLDDQMTPGAISRLTLSDEVAFRVEFDGPIPDRSDLYWRGPVFWYTDGVKWVPDRNRAALPELRLQGEPVAYTVTMEPTENNWMFALEMPAAPPGNGEFTHDMQIRTDSPVDKRLRYTLQSYPDFALYSAGSAELARALQLPNGMHSRAVQLAASWRESGLERAAIVNRALEMFNREEFYYTLAPPPLLRDNVDQFLFETRRGFCEHYAAAFVVLMRAARLPARVVTGYQGGTLNAVGNYVVVRQRDAHAWAEVWLGRDGWVRVDPTAAVSPSRISDGIDTALPESSDVPLGLSDIEIARNLWEQFRDTWDAINNGWNQWVLGYDHNRQFLVLKRIGLGWLTREGLVLALVVAAGVLLLVVAVWVFRGEARRADPAAELYRRFCRRLARAGVERRPHEGPRDFAQRASRRFPRLAAPIRAITDLYLQVRYAGRQDALPALRVAVAGFKTR